MFICIILCMLFGVLGLLIGCLTCGLIYGGFPELVKKNVHEDQFFLRLEELTKLSRVEGWPASNGYYWVLLDGCTSPEPCVVMVDLFFMLGSDKMYIQGTPDTQNAKFWGPMTFGE